MVDACEIGQRNGMLTVRAGRDHAPPVCIACPASSAAELVGHLRTASVDAEELYWQTIPVALRGVDPRDTAAATAAMESWLLKQDWPAVVRRVPAGADEMFLVSHVGHVGLAIAPPFIDQRTLAIFDPMQLQRLAPSFQSALAEAHANVPPAVTPQTVTAVVEFLIAQPWPAGQGHQEPTFEEAAGEMQRRYQQFLTREPYLRPEKHDVPDM